MKSLFKKTKYADIKRHKLARPDQETLTTHVNPEPNVPTGSWIKCNVCGETLYREDFQKNYCICPKCDKHHRMSAPDRLKMIVYEDSFDNMFSNIETVNVLEFKGYDEKIQGLKEKTSLDEAVLTGVATIEGESVAIGVMDSRFLMGSMGHVVGEKITLLTEYATEKNLPLTLFTASGGARMQEGIISLMQMAKTSAAMQRFHESGGLYITVLTDPTSGGVTASFAMLGDIILSEPGAFIGFAGPRVIRDTIRQELPEGFQRAEFLLDHGFIDAIIKRKELRNQLSKLVNIHNMTAKRQEKPLDIESDVVNIKSAM